MPRCLLAALLLFPTSTTLADTVFVVSFTTGELIRYESSDPAGTRTVLSGSGSLVKPAAITIGPDGDLYIGEDGDGASFAPRITKFEPATLTLSTVVAFGGFEVFPASLAFQGDDLLVGRNPFFGNTGPIVRVANATGGAVSVSDYTSGGGLASSPGLARAADGQLFVADQTYDFPSGVASGPVSRFDATGAYVGPLIASGSSGLAGPTGLVLSGSALYTASIMNGAILRTDLTTGVTTTFATLGSPFEIGALAPLADGGLLAGSPAGSGNIYRFSADGTLLTTYSTGLGQIGGIATVPEPGTGVVLTVAAAAGWFMQGRRRRA